MRHGKKTKKLGRTKEHREAMLANMAASLVTHRRIQTTVPKAKAVRPFVDKLATLAKRGDLSARRLAAARIRDPRALKVLFEEHAPHWSGRASGFTRLVRIGPRKGDGAEMAVLQLLVPVPEIKDEKKDKKDKGEKSAARTPKKAPAKRVGAKG
jgi:large subunit ribosomal protein L17